MSVAGGIWAPAALRLLRVGLTKTTKVIRAKLANATRPVVQAEFAHIPIRTTGRQPIHPSALLRQKRAGRWYSTQGVQNTVRRWISTSGSSTSGNASGSTRFSRASFPTSNTARSVGQSTGRAPFASTLRPNLTGGAIARTQGGYTLGGGSGVRYFSHTPAAPAQVIQNVSVAMRAFCLSGQKVRYDGLNGRGDKRYRAVSELEQAAYVKMMGASARGNPGSFVDFHISPTVTALSPLATAAAAGFTSANVEAPATTLNEDGFLDVLSIDFARALKDLAVIFADLKRLAVLGDLPITMEKESVLRVRFPGVDAETVERLCDDAGVQRGIVGQDADFDAGIGAPMALHFPHAPGDDAKTITSPGGSARSLSGIDVDLDEAFMDEMEEHSWMSDPEGYESMMPTPKTSEQGSDDYDGLEGIYRFLEECDRNKDRF
ncbi:casein kinase II beta 2 subunit [Colletotrichum graminicola]|uniref:Casein kinase II beta 2 subunit n=1 Tax=Colletotrichum graminicola (strain M1.001 / M2 / FGSC 10212) TaxID=645133 RepID=E3QD95_COLGM|nr:casein kinase II beta 2 subunit [Colletotrichum graminicola M1.001]EFQ28867.1 casein kinase II beta 2 subunit [Colletotrichum graminicola M1.001]WDK19031.1 casein kinase II beta 2 subunit [Colletotrichum graminicola]